MLPCQWMMNFHGGTRACFQRCIGLILGLHFGRCRKYVVCVSRTGSIASRTDAVPPSLPGRLCSLSKWIYWPPVPISYRGIDLPFKVRPVTHGWWVLCSQFLGISLPKSQRLQQRTQIGISKGSAQTTDDAVAHGWSSKGHLVAQQEAEVVRRRLTKPHPGFW